MNITSLYAAGSISPPPRTHSDLEVALLMLVLALAAMAGGVRKLFVAWLTPGVPPPGPFG